MSERRPSSKWRRRQTRAPQRQRRQQQRRAVRCKTPTGSHGWPRERCTVARAALPSAGRWWPSSRCLPGACHRHCSRRPLCAASVLRRSGRRKSHCPLRGAPVAPAPYGINMWTNRTSSAFVLSRSPASPSPSLSPSLFLSLSAVCLCSDGDRQPSEKVKKLADEITGLTLLEVADLTKLLKVCLLHGASRCCPRLTVPVSGAGHSRHTGCRTHDGHADDGGPGSGSAW
eukprot:SAG31_NODE_6030_length_2202_cov_0.869710_3_plen_229_part_00